MKCKYQTEMLKWNNLPAHRKKGTLVMQAALGYLRGMMGKGDLPPLPPFSLVITQLPSGRKNCGGDKSPGKSWGWVRSADT